MNAEESRGRLQFLLRASFIVLTHIDFIEIQPQLDWVKRSLRSMRRKFPLRPVFLPRFCKRSSDSAMLP